MKYQFEEVAAVNYKEYIFPYKVYAQIEEGESIESAYNLGLLHTRIEENKYMLCRSVRIDLSKFDLSSENRRVTRKTDYLKLDAVDSRNLEYDYEIGKMAIDFYSSRFGVKTISAQKWKWIFTSGVFNKILVYKDGETAIGYCPTIQTKKIIHYAYPFYLTDYFKKNAGMGMILQVLKYAKELGLEYAYLGTSYTEASLYKTQFSGFEWFDGNQWNPDIELLKSIIRKQN